MAAVEDGQALSFPDRIFDAVVCSLGLMFFPDPLRGLKEFQRVRRPRGRAAVSVNTRPERSYNNFIALAIARHLPVIGAAAARVFSIGEESRLTSLFQGAGFQLRRRTVSFCPHLRPTSSPLRRVPDHRDRPLFPCRPMRVGPCGKRCGMP